MSHEGLPAQLRRVLILSTCWNQAAAKPVPALAPCCPGPPSSPWACLITVDSSAITSVTGYHHRTCSAPLAGWHCAIRYSTALLSPHPSSPTVPLHHELPWLGGGAGAGKRAACSCHSPNSFPGSRKLQCLGCSSA